VAERPVREPPVKAGAASGEPSAHGAATGPDGGRPMSEAAQAGGRGLDRGRKRQERGEAERQAGR